MPSQDLFIGFQEKPEDLKKLLLNEGYILVERKEDDITYERKDSLDVTLFYNTSLTPVEGEEEIPDWKGAGFNIVAELNVNFQSEYYEEALRIFDKVLEMIGGVSCDPNFEEYLNFQK